MSAGPERIRAWATTRAGNQGAWVRYDLRGEEGDVEYRRSSPELEALIEAAKARHANRSAQTAHDLSMAADAFARALDQKEQTP